MLCIDLSATACLQLLACDFHLIMEFPMKMSQDFKNMTVLNSCSC